MARKADIRKKQTFRIEAPGATKVLLVGEFTRWQDGAIPMQKDKNGVWTASVQLPPGEHAYRFMVDGQWTDDPDCVLRTPNPFGGQNMVRQVV